MNLSVKNITQTVPKDTLVKLFPRLQDERVRSFTTIVFTLVASAVFGLFAINPTVTTITELNKELADSTFVDQQLQTKIAALSSLQQQYNTMNNDLPFVMNAVPSSVNIPLLFGQLQAVADQSGITLAREQSFPVDVATTILTNSPYTSFAFDVDGTGSQEQVITFINNLDQLNRLITIDTIAITKASTTEDAVRVSIKGKAYFKPL